MKNLKKPSFLFVSIIIIIAFIKCYILSSSVNNYNLDIYTFRAYSLINAHTDEHGIFLPTIFQSRLGYEMPLNSYLYSGFFFCFHKFAIPEFVYEIFLSLLLGISIFYLTGSKISVLFISLCPYFLWPGNWTEKLFIALVFLAIKYFKDKNFIGLFIISILLLFTTTISIPLFFILLATIFFQKEFKKFWKLLFLLSILLLIFLKNFISLPYSKEYLINQNINIINNIEYKNALNQLRGEDNFTIFQKISRLLHNKLAIFTSIGDYSIRTLDLSLWFFNGDKINFSNKQLIPIFLPLYVLLIFFIPTQIKKYKKMVLCVVLAALFVGLNGEVNQSRLLIMIPFVTIILESTFRNINNKYKYILFTIAIFSFLPMIRISINYQPSNIFAYSTFPAKPLVNFINENQNKHIYISDEVYPDLGPQLKYLLKSLPATNSQKTKDIYQPYIRNIKQNVDILSSKEERFAIEDLTKINSNILNSIFLVSSNQYKKDETKKYKKYIPIIYSDKDTPIFYQMTYEIPKK